MLTLTSCNSWLNEDNAPVMSYDFYDSEEGLNSAIIAGYSYLRWGVGGERFNILTELGNDLFTEGEDGNYRQSFNRYSNQLNPDIDVVYGLWSNHYEGIGNVNTLIQKLEEFDMPESERNELRAQATFIRAFLYFDLVQQFGRIPLVTEGSFEVRTSFERSPVSAVYNQIIKDLKYSANNLSEEVDEKNQGRATKYAAEHLLAKVYLTRGSALTEDRGQKPTDLDSALFFSEDVIENGNFELVDNFEDLWKMDNQGNSEVIFAVQFTDDPIFNGNGNKQHLYFLSWYEDQPGMLRDIEHGRPWRRHVPTDKTIDLLFDKINDSRFFKSFQWVFRANNESTLPVWKEESFDGQVYFKPDPAKGQIEGELKFNVGDTAIFYTIEETGYGVNSIEMRALQANYPYAYFPRETHSIRYYPVLIKHLDPNRRSVMQEEGSREWVRMRLAETYLIAAEAAGRLGDLALAAEYINTVRKRAAWKEGEVKDLQIYKFLGVAKGDVSDTYDELEISESDLEGDFVEFILDERGRELLGELNRWEDLVRCEVLIEWVKKYNPYPENIRAYHKLRPIPQNHIDRLDPPGDISEEQNEGYY